LCIKHVGEKATVFNIKEMTCFMTSFVGNQQLAPRAQVCLDSRM